MAVRRDIWRVHLYNSLKINSFTTSALQQKWSLADKVQQSVAIVLHPPPLAEKIKTKCNYFCDNERQVISKSKIPHSRNYKGESVQAFGETNSRIVWVDKSYLRLADGCLENHRPIITNACPPERSQKALRPKLVPILLRGGELCFPAELPRTTQLSL